MFTLDMVISSAPVARGFGAGSARTIVPDTCDPDGMTTCPDASRTFSLTVAVNGSPGLAVRVLTESSDAAEISVPARSV